VREEGARVQAFQFRNLMPPFLKTRAQGRG
jgi:hypothetical protein